MLYVSDDVFLKDYNELKRVLKEVQFKQNTFENMHTMACCHKSPIPLCIVLWLGKKLFYQEQERIKAQIKVMENICNNYTALKELIAQDFLSQGEVLLAKVTLESLMDLIKKHMNVINDWHLGDKIRIDQIYDNLSIVYSRVQLGNE